MKNPNSQAKYFLKTNSLPLLALIFGFFGFLDATYLTILHFKNILPSCTLHGCDAVLASKYSVIFGIPVSLLGTIFYLIIIGFSLAVLFDKRKIFTYGLFLSAVAGLFVSAVLFFVQFSLIKSFCQYCLFSEAMSILIFVCCSGLYSKLKKY